MFRTELHISPPEKKISHKDTILSMGSCFSDHMGEFLSNYKFDVLSNPFGVIFNPISNNKLLQMAIKNNAPDEKGYLVSQDIHLHYDFHSQCGGLSKDETTKKITSAIENTHNQLQNTKWLIITWGTAIIYERKDNGEIVANCHKVPANQFNRRLLSQKEIIEDFQNLVESLHSEVNIILTVSPVRHLKETLELNSVSKSVLRIACHTLAEQHNNVYYFPSFELMMDDLRDYRFYKSDMLHPSEEAIQYIWQKFSSTCFDQSTLDLTEEWGNLLKAINHRPFNPNSESHQKFIRNTIDQIKKYQPNIDISKELEQLEKNLH